jgi:formyl-CoA transferase
LQSSDPGQLSYVRSVIADKTAGLFAFGAVCAALVQRSRTGEGAAIEVPMFEAFTAFTLMEHLYGLTYDPPLGEAGYERILSAERRPFRTADGWLGVVFYDDRQWQAFFDTIGKPELAHDPRFNEHSARTANTTVLYAMVGDAMTERTSAEWIELLRRLDVPAMPVLSVADVLNDAHLNSVGLFVTEEHPVAGRYTKVRNPIVFSTGTDDGRVPPARLGEHTAQVLGELGYDHDRIAALVAAGVAVTPR